MRLQFDTVLAAETVRLPEIQAKSVIDYRAIGIEESAELNFTGCYLGCAYGFADGARARAGKPQDADTTGAGWRSNRGDGAIRGHGADEVEVGPELLGRRLDTLGDNPLLCYRQHVVDDPV